MKRFFIAAAAVAMLTAATSTAQEPSSQDFKARYETMVSKLGPAGVGIETLINKWEAAYPEDLEMLTARFSYCFNKSQTANVEVKEASKYLGEKPVLTLKDTTGNDINYFQVISYDDELFGQAQKAIDKAIQVAPDRLDLRFLKTASLIGYENESPDMALSSLKGLVDYNFTRHPKWEYPGVEKADDEFSPRQSRSTATFSSSMVLRLLSRLSASSQRRCFPTGLRTCSSWTTWDPTTWWLQRTARPH